MNLPALATRLQSLGIMGKAFAELSREEAVAMVQACWDIIEPTDARRLPYFRTRPDGVRELISPLDSPVAFRTWLHEDGWLSLYRLLEMLGATDEEKIAYLGPHWMEGMRSRAEQLKTCPLCGTCKEDQ